jgi:hypothetical protein
MLLAVGSGDQNPSRQFEVRPRYERPARNTGENIPRTVYHGLFEAAIHQQVADRIAGEQLSGFERFDAQDAIGGPLRSPSSTPAAVRGTGSLA